MPAERLARWVSAPVAVLAEGARRGHPVSAVEPTCGTVPSYLQLAIVVPAIAVVALAGGIGAMVNGYTLGGLAAIAVGLVIVGFIVWFLRLPVRAAASSNQVDEGDQSTPRS